MPLAIIIISVIAVPVCLLLAGIYAAWLRDQFAEGLFSIVTVLLSTFLLLIIALSKEAGTSLGKFIAFAIGCLLLVSVVLLCDALIGKRHSNI